MNLCVFNGILTEDPVLEKRDGVSFLDLEILVKDYRISKGKGKIEVEDYLLFEVWDSGAETIAKLAKRGTKILVRASAKHIDNETIFRINEFEIQ